MIDIEHINGLPEWISEIRFITPKNGECYIEVDPLYSNRLDGLDQKWEKGKTKRFILQSKVIYNAYAI